MISETSGLCQPDQVAKNIVKDAVVSVHKIRNLNKWLLIYGTVSHVSCFYFKIFL